MQWYLQHYNIDIGRKKKTTAAAGMKVSEEGETVTEEVVKKSNHVLRKLLKRQDKWRIAPILSHILMSNSVAVAYWLVSLHDLVSVAVLTGISWKAKSWSST